MNTPAGLEHRFVECTVAMFGGGVLLRRVIEVVRVAPHHLM